MSVTRTKLSHDDRRTQHNFALCNQIQSPGHESEMRDQENHGEIHFRHRQVQLTSASAITTAAVTFSILIGARRSCINWMWYGRVISLLIVANAANRSYIDQRYGIS